MFFIDLRFDMVTNQKSNQSLVDGRLYPNTAFCMFSSPECVCGARGGRGVVVRKNYVFFDCSSCRIHYLRLELIDNFPRLKSIDSLGAICSEIGVTISLSSIFEYWKT